MVGEKYSPLRRSGPNLALKVLVDDPDPLSRAGLQSLLTDRLGAEELTLEQVSEADVVLVATGKLNAAVTQRLRDFAPEGSRRRVVMILDELGALELFTLFEMGVVALVYRSQATSEYLMGVLSTVHQGGTHLPPDVQSRLVFEVARLQRDVLAPRGLTASGLEIREVAVLKCIADGLEMTEIVERLQFSERAVKSILHGMMKRLNLRNRAHAVAYAVKAGYV